MKKLTMSSNPDDDSEKAVESLEQSLESSSSSSPASCNNEVTKAETNAAAHTMTASKLQLDKLGMVGREKEQQILTSSFDRMFQSSSSKNKQLVLVSGESGTGKSKLVHTLYDHASSSKHSDKPVLLARGKYAFNEYFAEPYSGVVAAFEDLFQQIKTNERDSVLLAEIGSALRDALGPAAETLTKLLPGLEDILSLDDMSSSAASSSTTNQNFNIDASQQQLKYAFLVLVRVLCEHGSALLLVLNDLQWADEASIDIMDYLLSDVQNTNALMVVGCVQSNDRDETNVLGQKIEALQRKNNQNFEMTDIEMGPFSLESTADVVMRMLSIDDPERARGLADLCFKRTMGNPHFLVEFLIMLKDEDLLHFGQLQWEWDESAIEHLTKSIDNLEDLLHRRMCKLSEAEKLILKFAACLGSSFQTPILKLVWTNHSANKFDAKDMESLLDGLQKAHYIESVGDNKYGWVHDKVQEAAFSMGDANESTFQFEIGAILYKTLEEDQLNGLMFTVVDLINQGNVRRRPELAMLNLQAAEKARQVSAFSSARSYVDHGIELLPSDKWKSHRETTLRLYTLGVQLGLATGDFCTMENYKKEILAQRDCTAMEQLPIQVAHIKRLCVSSQFSDAIELSLGLLKQLGCNLIPRRSLVSLQVITTLMSSMKKAKKIVPDEFCQSHPLLTDHRQKAIIEALSKLSYAGYLSGNQNVQALATTKTIEITLKHGINSESAIAFASLALISKSAFGDFTTARLLAETAKLLQHRVKNNFQTAGALFIAYVFSICWTLRLKDMIEPMKMSYLAGMRDGNSDYGFWCLFTYQLQFPLHCGKPLGPILAQCPDCLYQMEDYGMDEHCFFTRLCWQICLNYTGQVSEPLKLHGGIFNDNMDEETIPLRIAAVKKAKVELWVVYGAYTKAAELAFECGDLYDKIFNLLFTCMAETFYRGLALYAAYQENPNQRKFLKPAKRARKKLALWEKKGVPDVVHYHALLKAEQAAVDLRYKVADLLYQEAIDLAIRAEYLNCAGLFNERYATFLQKKDPYFESCGEEAVFRLGEAMRYYREWGAVLKVEAMRKEKMIYSSKMKLH